MLSAIEFRLSHSLCSETKLVIPASLTAQKQRRLLGWLSFAAVPLKKPHGDL
jgi:hypothetical protein